MSQKSKIFTARCAKIFRKVRKWLMPSLRATTRNHLLDALSLCPLRFLCELSGKKIFEISSLIINT